MIRRVSKAAAGTAAAVAVFAVAVATAGATGALPGSAFDSPLTITTTVLPTGQVGDRYEAQVVAAGGDGAENWAIHAGQLPNGLDLDGSTGRIVGTPQNYGSFGIDFLVTDADGNTDSATVTLAVNGPVEVMDSELPSGYQNDQYTYQLTPAGGNGTYRWFLDPMSIPDGMTFSDVDGTLAGAPTAHGAFLLPIRLEDTAGHQTSHTLRLVVAPAIALDAPPFPDGYINDPYTATITALYAAPGDLIWEITDGDLPDGLMLETDGETATITGKPTTAGTSTFTLSVTDSSEHTAVADYRITVADTLTITSDLPNAGYEDDYVATLTADGGITSPDDGGYLWTVTGLPTGLTQDGATITGNATVLGRFPVTITVKDRAGHSATQETTLIVTRKPVPSATATPEPSSDSEPSESPSATPDPDPVSTASPEPSDTATDEPSPSASPSPES